MIGLVALICSCTHTSTQSKSDWLYLGIPLDEEYPHTRFHLDSYVPQTKYWRVSRVRHVTKEDYERDLAAGRMLFRDTHASTLFYATEFSGDFEQSPSLRAWVTILERKAYP